MNKPLVLLLLSLAIIACVSKAPAQSTASGRLRVDVAVRSVHVRGDTIEIAHIVHNRRASRDSLFIFIVDARSGVLHMRRPESVRNWAADPDFGGRPMVFWTILQLLLPDSTSPALYYESIGIPGIAKYWVGGNEHPKGGEDDEPNPNLPPPNPLAEMISGQTVGVEPWPTTRTSLGLLTRLQALTDRSCSAPLSWITSLSLCDKLQNDLNGALQQMPVDRTRTRAYLTDYVTELSGSRAGMFAPGVTSSGYWLLKSNAEIILSQF